MDINALIGTTEAAAIEKIKAAGYQARIVEREGVSLRIFMNWQDNRVNLTIENGTVTKATIG